MSTLRTTQQRTVKSTQDLYVRGIDRAIAMEIKFQCVREGTSLARVIERLWRSQPRPSGG